MFFKGLFSIVMVCCTLWCGSAGELQGRDVVLNMDMRSRVESVVKRQLELYPQSRLIDLYKNFFQDKFGPGHMVADTASAGAYIRRELALMRSESGGKVVGLTQSEVAEIIGWEGRFVRVDLAVIEMGIVSYKRFSEAFFESSSSHILPDIEKWKREWSEIEKIIRETAPQLRGFDEDSDFIGDLLGRGEYVVHHSSEYTAAYRPHYRLIRRDIWERLISEP
ncbi:MAG: hypothetical protein BGO30_09405 [Bacteroidetes bacterium 41-46]|nr:MAG: hypothetical protein BGO30_09405 [Bacteroidetes bacterium 41-46]